ncbi:MAG: hypothetical protein HN981_05075 [Candidatus Pacebacteria bacterium]|jgi:hypothetical protein|nr:hypothetical protein [Candidatus Paceibacterota bacterium]MBT4652333.1 hypothetical protein [Candidatus Paceibacterota bacterium]MBT6756160.1 hypothetical protein [Candidatus Paceibacterota bacterium]MBT6921735.1 hypothetical protein [Candidatus Paceibacterota bacterium]
MKKTFLIGILLASSFLFSACTFPGGDKDISLNSLKSRLGLPSDIEDGNIVPQVGAPVTEGVFDESLTEKAKKNGLVDTDIQQVEKLLAESFELDIAEVQITAEAESTNLFMTGYVNVGEGDKGGIYFAAKTDSGWEIAHNGVGIVYCELVEQYDFPAGMIPRCYDTDTGDFKER